MKQLEAGQVWIDKLPTEKGQREVKIRALSEEFVFAQTVRVADHRSIIGLGRNNRVRRSEFLRRFRLKED